MKKLALAAAFLAFSATASAAPVTYAIDSTHTAPRFEYSHFGFSNQQHRFNTTAGTIALDTAARLASVDITIDAKSVNTGYPLFNEHLQAVDFFDTAKYPTITFKAARVKYSGDYPKSIAGELTIKGITKPVTLTVTSFQAMQHPIAGKPAIGANAEAKVSRSAFGMDKYVPYVGDEVTLSIAVEAIQQ